MLHPGEVLRTPEAAFADLPDYPFAPHYCEVDGLRIHYVDEGSQNAKTIFLFHGQPSWSYLYRHMIPALVRAGYRVIAPDLVGFGKSDKPVEPGAHTYPAHVDWMTGFVRQLGIRHGAAFMQDWGGLIGLRVLAAEPEWLSRLVVANTTLPDATGVARFLMPRVLKALALLSGSPTIDDFAKTLSFRHWTAYFARSETLELGQILQLLTVRQLAPAEVSAYDAPFPDPRYYAGPRRMPQIVASQLAENHAAWTVVLEHWRHPVLTLFSDKDPFLASRGLDKQFQERFPGAEGQPHTTISEASHFLQEDRGREIAENVVKWLVSTGFPAAT
ncbi:MAG: alpha/beta fold hydrolase [Deltaproteobacteria bacterium]|nr:alpha/beta fold hydrolase [Deltaproteobacteria bacterium]